MAPRSKKHNSFIMLKDLPESMLLEILARLPLKTLLASKSVCKTFLDLSSNPKFIELHSSSAPQSLVFQFLESFSPSDRIWMLEPELLKFEFRPVFQVPEYTTAGIDRVGHKNYIHSVNDFFLMNSCNGLLYLVRRGGSDECSLVCNPVTNEYIWVIIPERRLTVPKSQWLGFDASSNKYKVLRLSNSPLDGCFEIEAQILELGSSRSRNLGNAPLGLGHCWDTCFTFVNGVIHWFDVSLNKIVLFDFEKEMFGEVALPPDEHLRITHCVSIGELGGCLALSCNDYFAHNVDIWVMKKHGNQQWSKIISVDTLTPARRLFIGQFKPLQILSNGELLMICMSSDLVLYNPRNKSFRFVGLKRNIHPKVILFRPSFVSLKDTLKLNKVCVQNVRPRSFETDCIFGGLPKFSRGSVDDDFSLCNRGVGASKKEGKQGRNV